MDPALLAEAVDTVREQGGRVAAVIPTDLYGQCSDYDVLLAVCRPLGIPLLVDAAEAVGAAYRGRHAGRGGDAAVYSFNGNKIITTGGGGLLASDDKDFIDEARRLSQQARDPAPHYEHTTIGYNYRMSNVAAAIGLGQLTMLDAFVARRRAIFDWYRDALGHLPGVSFMPEAAYGRGNRWLTVMLIDEAEFGAGPEDVRLALEAENIESRPVWKPMHMQPVFADAPRTGGAVSEDLFRRGLCLPSGTAMTEADMARVARIVAGVSATARRGGGRAS
jgi:dTDP-4-amino-4,6-dideoxygalactose transaminase